MDKALDIVFKAVGRVKKSSEKVPLDEALNRVAASSVVSDANIPDADRAAMDGYAVVAEDTFGASETNSVELKAVGMVEIGEPPRVSVRRGDAVGVATGSYMPPGADAVIMVEYTTKVGGDRVQVVKPVVPSQNVSKTGEDVKKGQVVVDKGVRIRPQDVGILAALGRSEVSVVKKPRVAVISTGNELIDVGEERKASKIYDINRHMTKASVVDAGGEPVDLGIVKDNFNDIKDLLKQALSSADIVVISAGTSVGEKDLVPPVLDSLGSGRGMLVHGVSIRPGYPTGVAVIEGKPVVSLPGYPVSNATAFRVLVKPLIHRLLGVRVGVEPTVRARMSRRVANPGGLRTFVRVRLSGDEDGVFTAEPIMASGAGVISSLSEADGLVVIPEDCEGVDVGEEVEVKLLRPA